MTYINLGGSSGGGSSGPDLTGKPFIVTEADSTLIAERVLTAGSNITLDTSTPGQISIAASGGGGAAYDFAITEVTSLLSFATFATFTPDYVWIGQENIIVFRNASQNETGSDGMDTYDLWDYAGGRCNYTVSNGGTAYDNGGHHLRATYRVPADGFGAAYIPGFGYVGPYHEPFTVCVQNANATISRFYKVYVCFND